MPESPSESISGRHAKRPESRASGRSGSSGRGGATGRSVPAGLTLDNPHDRFLPPSRLPDLVQWVFVGAFAVMVVASGLFSLFEHWRRATVALGAAMLWLAVCRGVCDSRIVGVLAVRSRRFDIAFSAAIGLALVWLAASVDALGS